MREGRFHVDVLCHIAGGETMVLPADLLAETVPYLRFRKDPDLGGGKGQVAILSEVRAMRCQPLRTHQVICVHADNQ